MLLETREKSLYIRNLGMDEIAYVLKNKDAFEVWLDTPYHESIQERFNSLQDAIEFIDSMN